MLTSILKLRISYAMKDSQAGHFQSIEVTRKNYVTLSIHPR